MFMIIPHDVIVFARCPNGTHKSPSGDCETFIPHSSGSLPRCPNGYHRSPDGHCEAVSGNEGSTNTVTPSPETTSPNTVTPSPTLVNSTESTSSNVQSALTLGIAPTFMKVQNSSSNDVLVYNNNTLGFRVSYPKNWEIKEGKSIAFLSPLENAEDNFREGVLVSVSPSEGKLLGEFIYGSLGHYRSTLSNFNLIKSDSSIILANTSAQSLTYTFTKGDNMKAMDFGIIKNGTLYVIQFAAKNSEFDHYMPEVQKMIDSFEITT
jgi:hypothetical protein